MQSVCDIVGTIWFRVPTSEVNSDEVKDSFKSTSKIHWFNILTWKLLLGDWITFLSKFYFILKKIGCDFCCQFSYIFLQKLDPKYLISRHLTFSYLIIPLYQLTKNSVGMIWAFRNIKLQRFWDLIYVVGLIQSFFSVT